MLRILCDTGIKSRVLLFNAPHGKKLVFIRKG